MNKTALILAGALAFDLGVLVVSGQATETPKGPTASARPTTACGVTGCVNGKHFPDYAYIKLDAVTSREACVQKSGKVVDVRGIPMCRVPRGEAERWTPVIPKPQEPTR